jgi:hypothetical protein
LGLFAKRNDFNDGRWGYQPSNSSRSFFHLRSAMSETPAGLPRVRFAEAMSTLRYGTSKDQVLSTLREPDERRNRAAILPADLYPAVSEIWCYGVSGPQHFPTLGQVWIGPDDTVKATTGSGSVDPGIASLSEEHLRSHLVALNQAPEACGDAYDPLPAIQIVNRFQALGLLVSCGIAREYLRVSGYERLMVEPSISLLCRVLIEIPRHPALLPATYFGNPHPPASLSANLFPSYPMVILDDIPLLFVAWYTPFTTTGIHTIEPSLAHYREHGRTRPTRLHPSNRPLDALAAILDDERWKQADWTNEDRNTIKRILMNQLLRLVCSVYPVDLIPEGLDHTALDRLWASHIERFNALDVFWDSTLENYRVQQ